MARMQNDPKRQPNVPLEDMVATAQKKRDKSALIVEKGVLGKYQAKREAEVEGHENTLSILSLLAQKCRANTRK